MPTSIMGTCISAGMLALLLQVSSILFRFSTARHEDHEPSLFPRLKESRTEGSNVANDRSYCESRPRASLVRGGTGTARRRSDAGANRSGEPVGLESTLPRCSRQRASGAIKEGPKSFKMESNRRRGQVLRPGTRGQALEVARKNTSRGIRPAQRRCAKLNFPKNARNRNSARTGAFDARGVRPIWQPSSTSPVFEREEGWQMGR